MWILGRALCSQSEQIGRGEAEAESCSDGSAISAGGGRSMVGKGPGTPVVVC